MFLLLRKLIFCSLIMLCSVIHYLLSTICGHFYDNIVDIAVKVIKLSTHEICTENVLNDTISRLDKSEDNFNELQKQMISFRKELQELQESQHKLFTDWSTIAQTGSSCVPNPYTQSSSMAAPIGINISRTGVEDMAQQSDSKHSSQILSRFSSLLSGYSSSSELNRKLTDQMDGTTTHCHCNCPIHKKYH